MENFGTVPGKLFFAKFSGIFAIAFILAGGDEEKRHESYCISDERTIARMLYAHGYLDEPQLFQLVEDGYEGSLEGVFPFTLIIAILLGLAEVPEDIGHIQFNCSSFLDPPGTRKLAGE